MLRSFSLSESTYYYLLVLFLLIHFLQRFLQSSCMKLQKKDKNESLHNKHFVLCYMSFSLWATDFAIFGLYLILVSELVCLACILVSELVCQAYILVSELVCHHYIWFLDFWIAVMGYVLQSEKQYTIQYCMDNVHPTIFWHANVFDIPCNCRPWSHCTAAW